MLSARVASILQDNRGTDLEELTKIQRRDFEVHRKEINLKQNWRECRNVSET
jgi:hypothetical protein